MTSISKAYLTIDIEMSKLLQKQVKYLGHIIGHSTIQTDYDKAQVIRGYPLPKSLRQLRRFLGVAKATYLHKEAKRQVCPNPKT